MSGSGVCFPPQSLNVVKVMHVNADNLEELASYVHPDMYIANLDQWFRVTGIGPEGEKLLEIPIGIIGPKDTIVITVGLYFFYYNRDDLDPRIGLSDSKGNQNLIIISDKNDFDTRPPCTLFDAISQDNPLVSDGTPASATYKLTFFLGHKYGCGICESAQDGGYMNIGSFYSYLDRTEPLSFGVYRGKPNESNYFRFLTIEIMTHD